MKTILPRFAVLVGCLVFTCLSGAGAVQILPAAHDVQWGHYWQDALTIGQISFGFVLFSAAILSFFIGFYALFTPDFPRMDDERPSAAKEANDGNE